MDDKPLALLHDSVKIQGKYYTISNGFITERTGVVELRYADLLMVEFAKHCSKKLMYATLLLGAVLVFALDFDSIVSAGILVVLTLVVCAIGLAHFFSSKQFIEITSMQGTYRIEVKHRDTEIERVVNQLRSRIFSTK